MIPETERKGQIAQLQFELAATKKGFVVSRPTTEVRYDYILDDFVSLKRVQVKYCDAIDPRYKAYIVNVGSGHRQKSYTSEEIDGMVVFFPKEAKVCWFEPKHFQGKEKMYVRKLIDVKRNKKTTIILENQHWI